jgi:hypothetical protein
VPTRDTAIDPAQPSLLLKKKNMVSERCPTGAIAYCGERHASARTSQ